MRAEIDTGKVVRRKRKAQSKPTGFLAFFKLGVGGREERRKFRFHVVDGWS
jgi:hypothetical protein